MKPKKLRAQLLAGQYRGGIRIGDTGMVINSRLLEAIVPEEEFWLDDTQNAALWQGKRWRLAWVPQRSWYYEGRLVAERNPTSDSPALISTEDVSRIGQHINRDGAPPGEVVFRPINALEDPLQDTRAAIKDVQERHKRASKGWREDGSWGPLTESSKE